MTVMEISYFKSISDRQPMTITVGQLVDDLRNGRFARQVQVVRMAKTDEERTKAKKRLPAVTVSGIFDGGHKAEQLVSHSGLIQLDFDKVGDVAELKAKLSADPYTLVAFISPSGTGLKAIVKIPTPDNKHWVKHLARYYHKRCDVSLDEQCCDTSRLCFVSHDTDAYYNPDAKMFEEIVVISKFEKQTNQGETPENVLDLFQKAITRTDKKSTYTEGNRNTYVFNLACQCHHSGISQSEAENMIAGHFDLPQREIASAVKSAYSYPTSQKGETEMNKAETCHKSVQAVLDESTILNSSIIDSIDPDSDFDRYGFFISDGCYYTRENKRNHCVEVKLSNFVMQVLYKMDDGTNNTKRLIKMQRNTGENHIVEASNNDTHIEKFELILKSCSCTFFGSTYHFKRIFEYNMDFEQTAIVINRLGHQGKYDVYALGDSIITANNHVLKVNRFGIVKDRDRCFYLPAFAETNMDNPAYEEERQFTYQPGNLNFEQWSGLLYRAFDINGAIGICFLLHALFHDLFIAYKNFFPFLYLFGQAGVGKTSYVDMILRLLCRKDTGTPATGSTEKGIARSCSARSNMVVYIKEWDKTVPDNLIRMFKCFYDGVAYKTAQTSNDNRTNTFPVTSGIIIDGNVLPTQEPAFFDRMIVLTYEKNQFADASRQAYEQLMKEAEYGFGKVLCEILSLREHYQLRLKQAWTFVYRQLKGLPAEYPGWGVINDGKIMVDGTDISCLPERAINHITFILSAYVVFADKLKFPFSFEDLCRKVITDMLEKNEMFNDLNDISIFWDALNYERMQVHSRVMEGKHYIKDLDQKILYVKVNLLHPFYVEFCKKNGMEHVDLPTFRKQIKSYPAFIAGTQESRGDAYTKNGLGSCYRFSFETRDYSHLYICDKEVHL